jgi:phosphate transport system substrate-binding protein
MNSNSEELVPFSDPQKPLGGRYKVVCCLGEGGFCQTFVAEDLHLPGNPRCIVKQLNPHFETEEELETARRLFENEAKVLYRLGNHDQIPRLLAHFEHDQKFYLAQELIDGATLEQLMDDQPWSQADVVTFLKDLLQVLVFVHEQGVIHRDIKPSNLIRREQDGRIVLIDFGAVKQVGAKSSDRGGRTDLTISIGTQGYTPSEQLVGNPQFSSDIYAAGMVAIRALTNIHPKNLQKDPQTHELQWQVEGVSVCSELAAVLDRMVCFDFRQRYSTVDEVLAALWWDVPTDLLKSSSDLQIQDQLATQPQSTHKPSAQVRYAGQRSPKTTSQNDLPTLRQVFLRDFLPNFLRGWMPFGGLAVVGLTILIAASVLSFRSGSLWSNQHVNQTPASPQSPDQQNPNPSADPNSGNSSATSNPEQDNSTAFSKPDGFASILTVPSGLFNYGGSTTWVHIRREVDPILQAANPGFKLRYTEAAHATPGSGTGIRMLLDGQLAFAQSSRPVEDEEHEQANLRGFSLKQIPVALDAIVFVVHPKLSVSGLSLNQIRDIYMGKITNWRQVGGPDLAITPYSRRPADGGTPEYFVHEILDGGTLGGNVKYVYSTTDAVRKVDKDPGGIYYASAVEVVPQCKVKPLSVNHLHLPHKFVAPYKEPLVPADECPDQTNQLNTEAFRTGDYPFTRQLFVIVKQDGQLDQQAGEAYAQLLLTNEGQELITKAGFVRIH